MPAEIRFVNEAKVVVHESLAEVADAMELNATLRLTAAGFRPEPIVVVAWNILTVTECAAIPHTP